MKRLGLLIFLAAVAAAGVVYTVHRARSTPHTAVTALLSRTTVALVHFPDFNRTRDDWHRTDIYKLYQEPAVQDFLNKPLSKIPQRATMSQTLAAIQKLAPKDAFFAVTSIEDNNLHFVGGFRFRGSQSESEKIVGPWRARLVNDASMHENVDYENHQIDIAGAAPNQLATAYDGQWFFASNDLTELKAVLDRADRRAPAATSPSNSGKDTVLETDETFRAAMTHMPSSYALLFYLQPLSLSEKLTALRNAIGPGGNQNEIISQIRSICGATRFDNGKMRDVLFVGMSRTQPERKLTRSSLDLGTPETFLYIATLLNPDRFSGLNQAGSGLPAGTWLQKVFNVAGRAGLTTDDWNVAFDLELGSLANWAQNSRWPSIIATLRVKDFARASKLVEVMTHAIDEDAPWTKSEKDGVVYFYMQTPGVLFGITPTIALSQRAMIIGLDSMSVETAMKRSELAGQKSATLADSSTYKTAARAVPVPTEAFVYVDTGLLYSRLDAALRPMLLMSAAFMPAVSDYVDVGKLPPPEIVVKHLSPIVSSQRYEGDGYVTESVGPVTPSEAAIGLGFPAIFWGAALHPGR